MPLTEVLVHKLKRVFSEDGFKFLGVNGYDIQGNQILSVRASVPGPAQANIAGKAIDAGEE